MAIQRANTCPGILAAASKSPSRHGPCRSRGASADRTARRLAASGAMAANCAGSRRDRPASTPRRRLACADRQDRSTARGRLAVDQHLRLVGRIMREIAAVPHRADDIAQRRAGRGVKALRQCLAELVAGKEHRAIAMIEIAAAPNNWRRRRRRRANTTAQAATTVRCGRASSAGAASRATAREKPQRIAPHRDGAAAAHGRQRDRGGAGPKASSVTMRRSKASGGRWLAARAFRCRGQNSAAAMNSDGSAKKIWLAANTAGWRR